MFDPQNYGETPELLAPNRIISVDPPPCFQNTGAIDFSEHNSKSAEKLNETEVLFKYSNSLNRSK